MFKNRAILSFARSQRVKYGCAGEGISDRSVQVFAADLGFEQVVSSTQLHSFMVDRAVSFAGEEDERFFASLKQGVSQEVQSCLRAQSIVYKIEIVFFLPDER